MTNSPAGGPWAALIIDVEQPARPALRVEVAGRGLLVLRQDDTVVFMARVDDDLYGVDYARTGLFRSPVPPIRAAHAARIGADGPGSVRQARWAHHFAAALAGAGPLHTGRWVISADGVRLRPGSGAHRWADLLLPADRGWIDWFADNGSWRILPLRTPAGADAGRVKAYRKQAREGTLAPVLLWWISGLDCSVVLDGHDRLVAALAEGVEPPLLALSPVSAAHAAGGMEKVLNRYTASIEGLEREVSAGTPGSAEAKLPVNRRLAENLQDAETRYGRTRAWPLRGGTARWNALAEAQAPQWYAESATTDEH